MGGSIANLDITNTQLLHSGPVRGADAIGGDGRYLSATRQTCARCHIFGNADTAGTGINQKICLGAIDTAADQVLIKSTALQRETAFATFDRADYVVIWIALAFKVVVQQQCSEAKTDDPHTNNHVATDVSLVFLLLFIVQAGSPYEQVLVAGFQYTI